MRSCVICEVGIEHLHGGRIYCSASCQRAGKAKRKLAWREENREQEKEKKRLYYLKNQEAIKETSREYRSKNPPTKEVAARRREKFAKNNPEYSKIWKEKNPDYAKNWRKNNPEKRRLEGSRRRARLKEAGILLVTEKDLKRMFWRQGAKCVGCSTPLSDSNKRIDHIIPIAKGGRHSIGNLQWLCKDCNERKSAILPVRWRTKLKNTHRLGFS